MSETKRGLNKEDMTYEYLLKDIGIYPDALKDNYDIIYWDATEYPQTECSNGEINDIIRFLRSKLEKTD